MKAGPGEEGEFFLQAKISGYMVYHTMLHTENIENLE